MKMSNLAGSFDGPFCSNVAYGSLRATPKVVACVGLVLASTVQVLVLLFARILRWQRRPKGGYKKPKTFRSGHLLLNSSHCSFVLITSQCTTFSSIINKSGLNLERLFTLIELCDATRNFDENAVVGVGGFEKVYLGGTLDGTKLAIKRGNPSSSQGINEFETEIRILSKLRHQHLVSLIGYCDEQAKMILIYECMA